MTDELRRRLGVPAAQGGAAAAAEADDRPREFVPAEPKAENAMLGRALAASGDRDVDAKLALYCALNL